MVLKLLSATPRARARANEYHVGMNMTSDGKFDGRLVMRGDMGDGGPEDDSPPIPLPGAALAVRAVVRPYEKSSEGELIKAIAIPWRRIVQLMAKDPSLAYQLSPRAWEEVVAAAFDAAGYDEVTLTPRSRDHGRDVIAVKHGVGSIRIVDSVKAYRHGHLVTYDDVRALLAVVLGDQRASKGIGTTTSGFPAGIRLDPIIAPHLPYRLELMDGPQLQEWLRKTAGFR